MNNYPRAECGICEHPLQKGKIVAMFSKPNSAEYQSHTSPVHPTVHNLCCIREAAGRNREAVVVHLMCFKIVRRLAGLGTNDDQARIMDRIWTLACWRSPWMGARPAAWIIPEPDLYDTPALDIIAEKLDLALLTRPHPRLPPLQGMLPPEILIQIYWYSHDAWLWKCFSAVSMGRYLAGSKTQPADAVRLPLSKVSSWTRWQGFELAVECSLPPVIKLTLASYGIQSFERLDHVPPSLYKVRGDDRYAYVFIDERDEGPKPEVISRDGLIRLYGSIPDSEGGYDVWDTAYPGSLPKLDEHNDPLPGQTRKYRDRCRHRTADLSRVSGITLLFDTQSPQLLALHGHDYTPNNSIAFDRLKASYAEFGRLTPVYVPLSCDDEVLQFVLERHDPDLAVSEYHLLVRTKLCGEFYLGLVGTERPCRAPDCHMAHTLHEQGTGPTLLCSYISDSLTYDCLRDAKVHFRETLPQDDWVPSEAYFPTQRDAPACGICGYGFCARPGGIFYSEAPLEDVVSVREHHSGVNLRGLVLAYRNGGVRALGQCMIDSDTVKTVAAPTAVRLGRNTYGPGAGGRKSPLATECFLKFLRSHECAAAQAALSGGLAEEVVLLRMHRSEVVAFPMKGVLEWWFKQGECRAYVNIRR